MQTWLYIPVLAACARTSNRSAGRLGEGIPRQLTVRAAVIPPIGTKVTLTGDDGGSEVANAAFVWHLVYMPNLRTK